MYLFFSFLSIETQHTLNRLTIVYFHCDSAISVPSFKCSKNYLIIYLLYPSGCKALAFIIFPFLVSLVHFFNKFYRFIIPFLWLFRSFYPRKGTFLKKFVRILHFFQHISTFVHCHVIGSDLYSKKGLLAPSDQDLSSLGMNLMSVSKKI